MINEELHQGLTFSLCHVITIFLVSNNKETFKVQKTPGKKLLNLFFLIIITTSL